VTNSGAHPDYLPAQAQAQQRPYAFVHLLVDRHELGEVAHLPLLVVVDTGLLIAVLLLVTRGGEEGMKLAVLGDPLAHDLPRIVNRESLL
jgi:hypothetical protein